MPTSLRHPSLVPFVVALACSPAEPPHPEPAPKPATPAATTPTTAAPTPTAATPTTPTPTAATPASPPATPSAGTPAAPPSSDLAPSGTANPSQLRVVAVREGYLELSGWGSSVVPLLEGEPLAIVDGRPQRGAAGSWGLGPTAYLSSDYTIVAVGGRLDQSGGAWLALGTEEERSTAVNLAYHLQGPVWEPVDLRRGLLRAHHAFYVERDGALYAYQRWALDHEQAEYGEADGSPEAMAFQERVTEALKKVEPGFTQLAGAPSKPPVVPATDATPHDAATASDGTIYALTSPDHYDSPKYLLVWPPGAVEAKRAALPGLSSTGSVEMTVAGEHVLVHGQDESRGYLAVGKGTELQEVAVDEADRDTKSHDILGAARAPDGALWIAFGNRWNEEGEEHPVWRKPADGAWQPVPLPAFDRAWFPTEPQWGMRAGYGVEPGVLTSVSPRSTLEDAAAPTAAGLRWGDGAVWVSLEVGSAYADDDLGIHPRSVLLSTAEGSSAEPPVTLPSAPAIALERHNHAHQNDVPGAKTCRRPALVLGPASLVDTKPDAVRALRDQAPTSERAPGIEHAYVGELDGTRVLVGLASVRSPKQAKALITALEKATGLTVTAGCRIPAVERMLE